MWRPTRVSAWSSIILHVYKTCLRYCRTSWHAVPLLCRWYTHLCNRRKRSVYCGRIVEDRSMCDGSCWLDGQESTKIKQRKITGHHLSQCEAKSCITSDACKIPVHALVTSRLDYCNALLYGLPQTMLKRLHRVQNCAARLICRRKKHDHVTPLLKERHWLPIHVRPTYKLLTIA